MSAAIGTMRAFSCGLMVLATCLVVSAEDGAEESKSIARSHGIGWTGRQDKWEYQGLFTVDKEFARRPPAETLKAIVVDWKEPKIDRLANTCVMRGQLLVRGAADEPLKPIDWFQGVYVFMAKRPKTQPDWSRGITEENEIGETDVTDRNGIFQVTLDLRETEYDRFQNQPLQIGLALADHKPLGETQQHVTWRSRSAALPDSIKMLQLPAPAAVSRELDLINRAARWPFDDPDGVALIQAVNALQPLGKDAALRVLGEYLEICRPHDSEKVVFWIVRLLFEPVRLEDRIPVPAVAIALVRSDSDEAQLWPLNPLELVGDVPFMVGRQIGLGGMEEYPTTHLEWARRHGVIRDEPLRPTMHPLAAAELLITSPKFDALGGEWGHRDLTLGVRAQALAMVQGLVRPIPEIQYDRPRNNARWKNRLDKANELGIVWDDKTQTFVKAESVKK